MGLRSTEGVCRGKCCERHVKNSSKGGGYHSSQRKLGPGMMVSLAAQEPVGGRLYKPLFEGA